MATRHYFVILSDISRPGQLLTTFTWVEKIGIQYDSVFNKAVKIAGTMFDNLRNRLEFDDLLFEKRNKDYGAYQLRKRYNSVIVTGLFLAILLMIFAVVLPFVLTSRNDNVLTGGLNYVQVHMENLEPPIDAFIVPPAPPPPEETHIQEVVKYIPPVVVDTVLPLEPTQATADEILAQSSLDKLDVSATGTGDDLFSGQEGSDTGETFFVVEVMPMFKGGDVSKFAEWVARRTNYPQAAADKKIRGTVYLTFIVEKDGSVSNVTVVKGVDPLLDNEAVKAISESPKWTPGLQRGQPVRVRFSIPLNFMF